MTVTTVKMSDEVYWGTDAWVIERDGVKYRLDSAKYEVQAGVTTVDYASGANQRDYTINFPRAFSATPIVIVSNASPTLHGSFVIDLYRSGTTTGITTTRFIARIYNGNKNAINGIKIAWLALVPKSTLSGANKASRGTNIRPTAPATGKSLMLDDAEKDLYWALASTNDNPVPARLSLHETYYTFDYGTTTVYATSGQSLYTDVQFNKVFNNIPVVMTGYAGAAFGDFTNANTGEGQLDLLADTTEDGNGRGHTYFRLGLYNGASSARNFKINWIACALAE